MKIGLTNYGVFLVFLLLLSCTNDNDSETTIKDLKPILISLSLSSDKNSVLLLEDVKGEIIGDSIVECWVPYLMPHKKLYVDLECLGGAKLNGAEYDSKLKYDFSKPVSLSISFEGMRKDYIIYVHTFTGLPVLWIETEERQGIISRDEYISGTFKLHEDVVTRGAGDVIEGKLNIRGRGNSTWAMPKKPFRLKFEDKLSFFGMPTNKHYALLANYFDKSMLRTALAFKMGELSILDFTPKSHFVELILNGRYCGTYQFTESIRIDENRVNIGDDGILLEIDNHLRENEIGFWTPVLKEKGWPIRIHKPEVNVGDEGYLYIFKFVNEAEAVLYSDNFLDEDSGYRKFFDIESFVEWYLINEILENPTAADNCYLNIKRGGLIKAGPLWDFDLSIANNPYASIGKWGDQTVKPTGFWVKNELWMPQFFKDPAFVKLVKERFKHFYSHKDELFIFINEYSQYLEHSVAENDNRWHLLYNVPFDDATNIFDIYGNYQNEVQYIKNFINIRLEWLREQFENM